MISEEIIANIREENIYWSALKSEIQKVIVGQDQIIDRICLSLLCNGHVLLEGAPGLAKTTLVKQLSAALGLSFSRIQFTPDLLPADIVGTLIYNPKTCEFESKKGPIFSNIILADEINRAPAKVQSALLEAMQEHQATIGDKTYKMDAPFLVLATQNPIEQEGTYRLPEAQIDRFMFKLLLSYPRIDEEVEIAKRSQLAATKATTILEKVHIAKARELVKNIYVDDKLLEYIAQIVFATRSPSDYGMGTIAPLIEHGASPRGTIILLHSAKAYAFLKKRQFVLPDDIKSIARDVLRHRIILSYEAQADNVTTDQIIEKILSSIPTP